MSSLPILYPSDYEKEDISAPFGGGRGVPLLLPEEQPNSEALKQNARRVRDVSPDDVSLSKSVGFSSDIVSRNRPELKQRKEDQDLAVLSKKSPGTSKYLSIPDNMALSRDDTDNLSTFEEILVQAGRPFVRAYGSFERSVWDVSSFATAHLDNAAKFIEDLTGLKRGGLFETVSEDYQAMSRNVSRKMEDSGRWYGLPEHLKQRLFDNPWMLASPEYLVNQVAEAAGSMALPVIAYYLTGGLAGGAVAGGAIGGSIEAGNLYNQMVQEGKVDKTTALTASTVYGAVSGYLNRLGLDAILKKTATDSIKKRIAKSLVAGGVEGVTEWLEEPSQAVIQTLAEEGLDAEKLGKNFVESLKNIDVIPGAFLLGGGVSYSTQYRSEYLKAQRADHNQKFFEVLGDLSNESKTRERLPEQYEKAIEEIKKEAGGEVSDIYVDAQLFQESVDPEIRDEIIEKVELKEEYQDALNRGADLKIPTEKYAAYVAPTQAHSVLSQDIRFSESGMSFRQSAEFKKNFANDIQDEIKQVREEDQEDTDFEKERVAVYRDILLKRSRITPNTDLAKADAEYWAAFISVMAKRKGQTPFQTYTGLEPEVKTGKFKDQPEYIQDRFRRQIEKRPTGYRPFAARIPKGFEAAFEYMSGQIADAEKGNLLRDQYGRVSGGIKGTFPDWFKSPPGSKKAFTKDEFFGLMEKVEKGEYLTDKQQERFEELYTVAEEMRQSNPDLVMDIEIEEYAEEGYDLLAGQDSQSVKLNDGDEILMTDTMLGGVKEYRVEGNEAVALDGERVKLDTGVKVIGVRKGEVQFQEGIDYDKKGEAVLNKNFKKWFGDSKVVDENGEPLAVYHSTDAESISAFQSGGSAGLIYFAFNKKSAKRAARGKKRIEEVYLKAENPVGTTDNPFHWGEAEDSIRVAEWKEQGFDSVYVADEAGVSIAVFEPTQIKSVNNKGTFDPQDPRILFQEGRDENFKKWFGDSKVVDGDGNPLVVYHGTDTDFDAFDSEKTMDGLFWFSSNKEAIKSGEAGATGREVIKEVYLSIKNPARWEEYDKYSISELINQGYDGLALVEEGETTYVAFEPTQIKSVNNRGAFDPQDPRILFQSEQAPVWQHAMTNFIREKLSGSNNPKELSNTLKSWAKKGLIKEEELEWSGAVEWLKGKKGKVSKDEVVEFLESNQVKFLEVNKVEGDSRISSEEIAREAYQNFLSDMGSSEQEADARMLVIEEAFEDSEHPAWEAIGKTREGLISAHDNIEGEAQEEFVDISREHSLSDLMGEEYYQEWLASHWEEAYDDYMTNLEEAYREEGATVTKFSEYQVPGGENYTEFLLKVENLSSVKKSYKSPHFEEDNVLAHVRFNERRDTEGNKVLFIEEVQSDWHQEGRKKGYESRLVDAQPEIKSASDGGWIVTIQGRIIGGYRTRELAEADVEKYKAKKVVEGVPDAPFKKTWPLLAMKRMVRYAAENGFDKIAWTPGEVQNERYDLSKQIEVLYPLKNNDGSYRLDALRDGDAVDVADSVPEEKLEDYVGKEIAKKIIDAGLKPGEDMELSGLDLEVGGEGMKGFYDKILPSAVNKFFNKAAWGKAKVGTTEIDTSEKGEVVEVWALPITKQMKEKALSEGMPLFQKSPQKPRGLTDFSADTPVVTLFEKADPSTFLHESGHIFFRFLEQTAKESNAPKDIQDDWQTILDFVGNDGSSPLNEEQNEKLARALETYFMEGKAPSLKLRHVFQKFSDWLMAIYRSLKKRDSISPDIRGVMDRMFATERDIAKAKKFYEMKISFVKVADLQMDDQAGYEHLKLEAELEAKSRRLKRYTDKFVEATYGGKKQLQEVISEEVDNYPANKAIKEAVDAGGISIEVADNLIGEGKRKELSKIRTGFIKKDGEVDPEVLADSHGYKDAKAFMADVVDKKSKKHQKDALYEEKMKGIEAELQKTESGVPGADEDFHSDPQLKVLIEEVRILQDKLYGKSGKRKMPSFTAVREVARETLKKRRVRDAISTYSFSLAELKASKAVDAAIKKGDYAEAERQKRFQLLNHALVLESVEARKEVEKGEKFIRRTVNSKSIQQDSLDLIRDLSARFGFADKPVRTTHRDFVDSYNNGLLTQDKKIDFGSWAKGQEDLRFSPVFAPFILDRSNATPFSNMSLNNFREVILAAKQIETIDLNLRQVKIGEETVALDKAVESLIKILSENYDPKVIKPLEQNKKSTLNNLDSWLTKVEFLLEAVDGGSVGKWHETIFQPIAKAEEAELIRLRDADKKIKAIYTRYFTKPEKRRMFSKRIFVPKIGESITKAQMIRIALDMGNRSNYERRMDGQGWEEAQMIAIRDQLTKKDFDFIQDIWDFIGGFREEAFALEKEMTGREPTAILPVPLQTKHGIYPGGYFPVSFDVLHSKLAAQRQDEKDALLFFTPNIPHAMTKHGHLKERKKTAAGQMLSSNLADIMSHTEQVIHDLTHRRAVVNAAKILRDGRISNALIHTVGREHETQLMPWLKDIANTMPIRTIGEGLARGLRIGTTVAKLGKFSVMFQQVAGVTQSAHFLKKDAWRMLPAIFKSYGNIAAIPAKVRDVIEKSDFMRTRLKSYSREAYDVFQHVTALKSIPKKFGETAMQGIGVLQFSIDMPTWVAGYDTARAKGMSDDKAINFADSLVRKSQGGGGKKDLSPVQRGHEYLRLFTMFYSFMNIAYNTFARSYRGKKISYSDAFSALMWVGLIGPIAAELLSGRPPEEEKEEEWAGWAVKVETRFFTGMVPFFRDVAGAGLSGFGYQMSPVEGPINTIIREGRRLPGAIEDNNWEPFLKIMSESAGVALKIPSDQSFKTAEAFWAWLNDNPEFKPKDLIYGGKYED